MGFYQRRIFHCSLAICLIQVSQKTFTCTNAAALENFTVIDFLKDIRRWHDFENVLLLHNRNASIGEPFISVDRTEHSSVDEENRFVIGITNDLQMPVLQMNELTSFYMKSHFSELMMTVVYLEGTWSDHSDLLKQLVLDLRHMTTSKVLFLLNYEEVDEELLEKLFRFCWQNKIINVVALFANYQDTATYYSYTHFPEFEIETKTIHADVINRKGIYPYRLGNLKGYKFPFKLGSSDPRIIVYQKPNGAMHLGGFVGHFLQAFAKKYNCTLVQPLPSQIGAFASAIEMESAVRNGSVELSSGLTLPVIPFIGFTYPYEQMNWCLMMPVEADVPHKEYFFMVFETSAFLITLAMMILITMVLGTALYQHGYKFRLLNCILRDECFRGVLSQSFMEVMNAPLVVRFIYLHICMLGILLTTSYNAYFSTYVTSPPKMEPLKSFDDLWHSGFKVFAWTPELQSFYQYNRGFMKYSSMFHREPDFKKYLQVRDSLNSTFSYMMPSTKWTIINEQQRIFATPIFRLHKDLCFFNNIPMSLPVHENSIYMETLHQLMLETAQSGLTEHWKQNGFIKMIAADRMSFTDLSEKKEFEPVKAGDLYYIWIDFGAMAVLMILVFMGELCVFHRSRIVKSVYGRLFERIKY